MLFIFRPELNEKQQKVLVVYHEYFYDELKKFFKEDIPGKINSYIFSNSGQKKILFGSANADVTKTWMYSTFVTFSNYDVTLKHEFAHCFAANFGTGIFKVAEGINPSLIEGIAVAADPVYDENTIDYMAALAYKNSYKVDLSKLFSGFNFFTQNSSVSYIYSGSFTQFLIDNFGIEKFKKIYSDTDFHKVYDESLNNLLEKYYVYLSGIEVGNRIDQANYYFGRKSIFYKVCPRYVADRLDEAWELFGNKQYKDSEVLFNKILSLTNNYSALIGYANSLSEQKKNKEAIKFLEKNISDYLNTSFYYNIEFEIADLLSEEFCIEKADSIYSEIIDQNPNRRLTYLSKVRQYLGARDSLLTLYLKGNDADKYIILKQLSYEKYNFNVIPVLINLSRLQDEEYSLFLKQFDKTIHVTDFSSAYAMFKLSKYMIDNLDFNRGRKMAALAMRYKKNWNFSTLSRDNYKKAEWFYTNGDSILNKIEFKLE